MQQQKLEKILVPILDKFIDSLYESEEEERMSIIDEAIDDLNDFLDKNNSEENWKIIHDFALTYLEEETKNNAGLDLEPIKQMVCQEIKW